MDPALATISKSLCVLACALACASGCIMPARTSSPPQGTADLKQRAMDCLKAGVTYPHNPAVRVEAIEAMESAKNPNVLPWIRSALLDDHPAVRFAACVAVGNARDQLAEASLEKCLSDQNTSVRVAALYARHRLGHTDQTGKIVTYLLTDLDPMVRRNAAMVLGMMGEPGAIPVLARAVKDDAEPGVRHHALEAMARLGNAEARQELTFMSNSGVGSDEVMAIQALSATEDRRFLDTFRYKLSTATHLETKLAAARGLGLLGSAEGYDVALQALTGPHKPVADENDPPAGQALRVRLLAANALGAIGKPDALDSLSKEMNNGNDPRVQIAAARAILDISARRESQPFATVPAGRVKPS
jgi:HEAT repeat protein